MTVKQAKIGRASLIGGKRRYFCKCAKCRKEWNVSPHWEVMGKYVCPECEGKMQ